MPGNTSGNNLHRMVYGIAWWPRFTVKPCGCYTWVSQPSLREALSAFKMCMSLGWEGGSILATWCEARSWASQGSITSQRRPCQGRESEFTAVRSVRAAPYAVSVHIITPQDWPTMPLFSAFKMRYYIIWPGKFSPGMIGSCSEKFLGNWAVDAREHFPSLEQARTVYRII